MGLFSKQKHVQSSSHSAQVAEQLAAKTPEDWVVQAVPRIHGNGAKFYEKQNKAMLRSKLAMMHEAGGHAEAPPRMIGYLAVTKSFADQVAAKGYPQIARELEARYSKYDNNWKYSIDAWDSLAARRALSDAGDLFQENLMAHNSTDDTRVLKVGMADPQADRTGMLRWTDHGENVELLETYTPEAFSEELAQLQSFAGHVALRSFGTGQSA